MQDWTLAMTPPRPALRPPLWLFALILAAAHAFARALATFPFAFNVHSVFFHCLIYT